jgi:hypothetical protein
LHQTKQVLQQGLRFILGEFNSQIDPGENHMKIVSHFVNSNQRTFKANYFSPTDVFLVETRIKITSEGLTLKAHYLSDIEVKTFDANKQL